MDLVELKYFLFVSFLQFGCCFPVSGYAAKYPVGQSYYYNYVTETLFNELDTSHTTQARKDVGVKFTGVVELTPVWNDMHQMIVKLSVSDTHAYLESVSRKDVQRKLSAVPRLPIYFVWSEGVISDVYKVAEDPSLSVNVKKGIASIFQLVDVEKTKKEVDSSGDCSSAYSVTDKSITKIKSNCQSNLGPAPTNQQPLLSESNDHQVTVNYHLEKDIISTATIRETFRNRLNIASNLGTSIEVKTELKMKTSGRGKEYKAASLEEAMNKISKSEKYRLIKTTLQTDADTQCTNCTTFTNVVSKRRGDLTSDMVGQSQTAFTFLELVDAVTRATESEIIALLKNTKNKDILFTLIDALGAAQTEASQKAVAAILNFQEENNIDLQERYLLACALSTHPHQATMTHLLNLYQSTIPSMKLKESLGEALGAAVRTYILNGNENAEISRNIQKALVQSLEDCKDVGCKAMQLRALGNAQLMETIAVILRYGEESRHPILSEVALKALRNFPLSELRRPEVQEVAKRIFLQIKRGYDTSARSHALSILLKAGPSKDLVRGIIRSSLDPWNTDYDKYIQARLSEAMGENDHIRSQVKEILKESEFQNWNYFAPKGKALAFTSTMGISPIWTVPYSMYTENTRAGVLKRSGMDVIMTNGNHTLPLYKFSIFAAGLESMLGEEIDDPDAVATAGLALDLLGMSFRPITFFEGSSGLLSAVWSAPSEPVSALQANLILQNYRQLLPLHNGFVVEVTGRGALSLDLSGSLSVSLWNKNAKSFIFNRAAVAVQGSARLLTAGFRSGMSYTADGNTVITFQTDCNFSGGIETCLQMFRPDIVFRHKVEKYESAIGFKKGYKAKIRREYLSPGVCYPLPKPNDKECRKMNPS